MSAPEVVHTHSNLEVVDNGGKIWSNPKSSTTTDYRQLPQPVELQPEYSPVYNNDSEATPPEKRSGMSLPSKAVAVVLAAMLVILGVGVGIGIAGGMAIQRSESNLSALANNSAPTATTTHTVTATATGTSSTSNSISYTPSTLIDAVLPINGTVLLNCPSIDASIVRIALGSTVSRFAVTCGTDTTAANQDILAIISYSLEDCAQACASYNRNYGQSKCVAATFQRNLTSSVGKDYGNCWLKNGTVGGVASTRDDYAGLRLQ